MCSPMRCRTCGKVTWSGCGRHVDEVLAGVPEAERCTCERQARPSLLGALRRRRSS